MKISSNRLILMLSLLFVSVSLDAVNPKRPWTFLVYIAADNNLNPEADLNISQMVKSSATNNAYILVYLNIKRDGEEKKTQCLVIQDGKIYQDGDTTAQDSGDANTLIKAMAWAVTNYPSDSILVDIWNHGSGSLNRSMLEQRGVCYDDTTNHYMTDRDYKRAFDIIVNQYLHGKKIDIIAFDACLMADIEVAFTLQEYANYLVSSQQTVPGAGFNYTTTLAPFLTGNPSVSDFARSMVSSYDAYYKSSRLSYTLSVMNLNKLTSVVNTTNIIAKFLNDSLKKDSRGKLANAIKQSSSRLTCPRFDEPTYLDLYIFYSNLYARVNQTGLNATGQAQLKTVLNKGISAISQCITANAYSKDFKKTSGMSIYFADTYYGIEPSYNNLYWTGINPAWRDFLNEYIN